MSTPTPIYDNITDGVMVESWYRRYPLESVGDSNHVIYVFNCKCDVTDYVGGNLDVDMTITGTINPPETSSSAYWIGDSNFRESDGGMMTFIREFSTVPATRTRDLVGSRSYPFPGTKSYYYIKPVYDTDTNVIGEYPATSGNSSPAPLYCTYTYTKGKPTSVPTVFKVTQNGVAVDYVSGGFSIAATGVSVIDSTSTQAYPDNLTTISVSETVSATVPNAATYAASVTNGDYITVDVQIKRYAGDIWVVEHYEMKAQ